MLWLVLRNRQLGGFKFRRQTPIGSYIVDFVCVEQRLVIEIDGSQHDERRGYDLRRTEALEAEGYRVVRFWNDEVLNSLEGVSEAILLELEGPSP